MVVRLMDRPGDVRIHIVRRRDDDDRSFSFCMMAGEPFTDWEFAGYPGGRIICNDCVGMAIERLFFDIDRLEDRVNSHLRRS